MIILLEINTLSTIDLASAGYHFFFVSEVEVTDNMLTRSLGMQLN